MKFTENLGKKFQKNSSFFLEKNGQFSEKYQFFDKFSDNYEG